MQSASPPSYPTNLPECSSPCNLTMEKSNCVDNSPNSNVKPTLDSAGCLLLFTSSTDKPDGVASNTKDKTASNKMAGRRNPKYKRTKQSQDRPKRRLNAYNLFFKAERARMKEERDSFAKKDNGPPPKPIGFEVLAKTIAGRWRKLPAEDRAKYQAEASEDKLRFEMEMETYHQKKLKKTSARLISKDMIGYDAPEAHVVAPARYGGITYHYQDTANPTTTTTNAKVDQRIGDWYLPGPLQLAETPSLSLRQQRRILMDHQEDQLLQHQLSHLRQEEAILLEAANEILTTHGAPEKTWWTQKRSTPSFANTQQIEHPKDNHTVWLSRSLPLVIPQQLIQQNGNPIASPSVFTGSHETEGTFQF